MHTKDIKKGFTLAEMLVVVLILAILAAATLPFLAKKHKKHQPDAVHGRYECYYLPDDDADPSNDVLYEREYSGKFKIYEGVARNTDTNGEKVCKFEPNPKAAYFVVQIVGGGGGGAYPSNEFMNAISATSRKNVTDSGNVAIPLAGEIKLDDYPSWVTAAMFNQRAGNALVELYTTGGDGGRGNGTIECPSQYGESCTPSQYIKKFYTGGKGGNGVYMNFTIPLKIGTKLNVVADQNKRTGVMRLDYFDSNNISRTASCKLIESKIAAHGGDASLTANGVAGANAVLPTCSGGITVTLAPKQPEGTYSNGYGGAGGYGLYMNESGVYETSIGDFGDRGGWSYATITPWQLPYSYAYQTKYLTFGAGGQAGAFKTLFFPTIKVSALNIKPGKAGIAGTATTAATSGGDSSLGTNLIKAKGGPAATESLKTIDYVLPYTQAAEIVAEGQPGYSSGFSAFIESAGSGGTSGIAPPFAFGEGGKGGGSRTSCLKAKYTKKFNSITVENVTSTCNDNDASKSSRSAGTNGKPGAVVIIW